MEIQDIKIIIGLGNPGPQYSQTYHNTGSLFVDYITKIKNSKLQTLNKFQPQNLKKFEYIKFDNLIIVKSIAFMNESGIAVKETLKHFKLKPENLLVIHDDSDIEIGKYKISFDRGSAGHNGVESIIKTLKTKNFGRLRIGIRPLIRSNQRSRAKASNFVLKKISKKDFKILEKTFEEAIQKYKIFI